MSVSKNDIYLTVSSIISEATDGQTLVTPQQLQGKHLRKDFNFDSLDVIKFIFLMEEKSGVKLPDKEIDALNLLEIDALVDYVVKHKQDA